MECAVWTGGDHRIAIGEADGHLWIRRRRGLGQEVRSDPLKGVIIIHFIILLPSSCGTIRCKDWREGGVS